MQAEENYNASLKSFPMATSQKRPVIAIDQEKDRPLQGYPRVCNDEKYQAVAALFYNHPPEQNGHPRGVITSSNRLFLSATRPHEGGLMLE